MSESNRLYERDRAVVANATKVRYNPMVIERGEGSHLIDADGRRYLDFGASWSLAHLGYDNQAVRNAIIEQLEKTTFSAADVEITVTQQ